MEWNKENTILLIKYFKEKKELWDSTCADFKDRDKKHDAWKNLADKLNLERSVVEKKMRSLIGQFQRELKKSGAGAEETTSKWFGFQMLLFLKDKNKIRSANDAGVLETPHESSDEDLELQPPRKKKKKVLERNELVDAVQALLSKTERDDCATFTSHLKMQMKDLETDQKYIAQKLISDVMFLARTNRLNYDTCVTNQGVISSSFVTNQGVMPSNCVTNQGVIPSNFVTNQGVMPSKRNRVRDSFGMPSSSMQTRFVSVLTPESTIQADAIGSTNLLNETKYSPCYIQPKESDVCDVTHKTELLDSDED